MVTEYMERNTLRNPQPLIVIILFFSLIFLSIKGKGYDPADLTTGDILKDSKIFRDLYSMHSQDTVSIEGNEIEISLYNLKGKDLIYYDNIPKSIVVIKAKNRLLKIPLMFGPLNKISYFIPKTGEPMLCVQDGSGGNAWNANPIRVISLSEKYFLKNVGSVSSIYDIDSDEKDELITYDDIWELGLEFLCHADAPGARIFWRVKDGILVRDTESYMKYYHEEIERIAKEIREFPVEMPNENSERLLSLILQKFLIYRQIGGINQGWDKFNQDIKHYDNQFFYLYRGKLQKIPIVDIEDSMKKSLEEKR